MNSWIKETDTVRATPSLATTWRRMQFAARPRDHSLRLSMLFTLASAVVQGLAFACFYPLFSTILDTPQDLDKAWTWAGVLGACTLLDMVLLWKARQFDHSEALADITHHLRTKLGNQLRRMPLEALYQKRTGELSAILAGNVDEVVTPMGMISAVFTSIIVTPVVATVATAFVDWRLALTMACIFPLAVPLYYQRRRISGVAMRRVAAAHSRTFAELVEYVQGLPVLRACNQVGEKAKRLREAMENLREEQNREQMNGIWPDILFSSLVQIGLLLVLALGVWLILAGSLNLAVLAALLVIVVRFSEPLSLFSSISRVFDFMEAGLEQIEQLLAIKPLPVPASPRLPERPGLCFEGVDFSYAGSEETILHDVSFDLPKRSLTALVGPSGSGKTTITRLIMRYADPQAGVIRIGGVDLREMEQAALMSHISVVFQDVYLFDDTILANIRMGRSEADDAEVEEAARAAHCHEFISRLAEGYQTQVGDIGGCLSGGERQRISIARAILKDSPIVILDEPTAALDTESEVAVQQAIDTLVRDRTVIVIAHRLSTIVGADTILVLDQGRIVERGGHAELLSRGGRYAAMWEAQQAVKDWHLPTNEDGE